MLPEEAVGGYETIIGIRMAGLEHLRHPGVADMAIAGDALFVDHPKDGFAAVASAKIITLCSLGHLTLRKPPFVNRL
jgi:hypothetical protein